MRKNTHYNLDSEKIVKTVEKLSLRIEERFPGSGLGRVSRELLDISRLAGNRSEEMARSHAIIRFLTGLLILIIVAVVIISVVSLLNLPAGKYGSLEIIQAMEAGINNKVAALYIRGFEDPVAVSAVNEVESLTTALARKVWQKLVVIHSPIPVAPHAETPESEKSEAKHKS